MIEPAVDFLAESGRRRPALELGIGTGRIALPLSRRGVRVHGIELSRRWSTQLRAQPGGSDIGVTIGDFATTAVAGAFSPRLPRAQHDHEPDHSGRAGRVLPQRRRAPGARRLLRHRELHPRAAASPARRDVHVFTATPIHVGFEEYDVAAQIASSHHYWVIDGRARDPLVAAPLRVAVGARPHGAARRDDAARAVERLGPRALHRREPEPHLGLAEVAEVRSSSDEPAQRSTGGPPDPPRRRP